jgi:hypothetical protein
MSPTPLRDDINRGVTRTDALSVASRRPIMKKQIDLNNPTIIMGAAFLGAEPMQIDSDINVIVITACPDSEILDRILQPPQAGNLSNKVRGFS